MKKIYLVALTTLFVVMVNAQPTENTREVWYNYNGTTGTSQCVYIPKTYYFEEIFNFTIENSVTLFVEEMVHGLPYFFNDKTTDQACDFVNQTLSVIDDGFNLNREYLGLSPKDEEPLQNENNDNKYVAHTHSKINESKMNGVGEYIKGPNLRVSTYGSWDRLKTAVENANDMEYRSDVPSIARILSKADMPLLAVALDDYTNYYFSDANPNADNIDTEEIPNVTLHDRYRAELEEIRRKNREAREEARKKDFSFLISFSSGGGIGVIINGVRIGIGLPAKPVARVYSIKKSGFASSGVWFILDLLIDYVTDRAGEHYCFDTSTLEEELECFEGHKKRQKRIEEIKKALQESDCTSPKYCWE